MRAITALALVSLLSIPLSASAGVIDVPGDQPTIAAAVAAASNGDKIRLGKKRHYEAVVTNKALSFIGKKGAIWDGYFGGSQHDQLKATASGVVVDGIQFENGGLPVSITGNDASVRKCRFRGCEDGVYVDGMRAEVASNVFSLLANSDEVVEIHGPSAAVEKNAMLDSIWAGIRIDAENAGSATVSKNLMDTCSEGMTITVLNAAAPKILKNVLRYGYRDGNCIEASNCDDARIDGNQIHGINYAVEAGIRVTGDRAHISKNVLEDLDYYYAEIAGIDVIGEAASITRNRIQNVCSGDDYDTYGVRVVGTHATVEKNDVTFLGGGGNQTFGVRITGSDAAVSKNFFERFVDEYTYGIHITGDRADVIKNSLRDFMYETTVYVVGDDFTIASNTIRNGGYGNYPIYTAGSASVPGAVVIEKNKIFNSAYSGISHVGNGAMFRKNTIRHIAGLGFWVSGEGNSLEGNDVRDTQDDAYFVFGKNNSLTKCTATDAGRDGFDIALGSGNTLFKCKATNCVAEGLDNGGTATVATKCTFKGNRIDYAGAGNMAGDSGTDFDTGGPGTMPQID